MDHWPRIIDYLSYNPFADPSRGRPKGKESLVVAFLSRGCTNSLGQRIIARRLAMRNSRTDCAKELAVDVKTLHGWETDRHPPSRQLAKRVVTYFGL
jgi:DNA-binding XRE family transcriptional regulator